MIRVYAEAPEMQSDSAPSPAATPSHADVAAPSLLVTGSESSSRTPVDNILLRIAIPRDIKHHIESG